MVSIQLNAIKDLYNHLSKDPRWEKKYNETNTLSETSCQELLIFICIQNKSIYPEHDTKECKDIKHGWFAVNTSTSNYKTSVSGQNKASQTYLFAESSHLFIQTLIAISSTVEHPTSTLFQQYQVQVKFCWERTWHSKNSFGRKSTCSIGHVTSSSNYSPNICLAKLSTKYLCKNFMGPIFFGGGKFTHTNRVTPTESSEPQVVPFPNLTWLNICQETIPKSNPMAKRPFWSTGNRVDQRSDRLRHGACGLKINQHWKAWKRDKTLKASSKSGTDCMVNLRSLAKRMQKGNICWVGSESTVISELNSNRYKVQRPPKICYVQLNICWICH